jgi:hypothetical protein
MDKLMAIAMIWAIIAFKLSTGAKLSITSWSDCGDASTLGKVTDLDPKSLEIGEGLSGGTVSGTGVLDAKVTGGTFYIETKSSMTQAQSYTGDICSPKTITQPMGSISWQGMSCPISAGPLSVPIGFQISKAIPAYLIGMFSGEIVAKATSDTGKPIFCVNIHLQGDSPTSARADAGKISLVDAEFTSNVTLQSQAVAEEATRSHGSLRGTSTQGYLPGVPGIPDIPTIPGVPTTFPGVPAIPPLPSAVPLMPTLPPLPNVSSTDSPLIPGLPGIR